MSKKRKVVLGFAVLVSLFCMAIGITAVAREREPQLLRTIEEDGLTVHYVKEKGEYYLYAIVEEKKTEEEIQEYKKASADPVETELMGDGWMRLVGAEHSEDCETYLFEDEEYYRVYFVMKIENGSIEHEKLKEWEK